MSLDINIYDENLKTIFESLLKKSKSREETKTIINYFYTNVFLSKEKAIIETFFFKEKPQKLEILNVIEYLESLIKTKFLSEFELTRLIAITTQYYTLGDHYDTNMRYQRLKEELFKRIDIIKYFPLFNYELGNSAKMKILNLQGKNLEDGIYIKIYTQVYIYLYTESTMLIGDIITDIKEIREKVQIEKLTNDNEIIKQVLVISKKVFALFMKPGIAIRFFTSDKEVENDIKEIISLMAIVLKKFDNKGNSKLYAMLKNMYYSFKTVLNSKDLYANKRQRFPEEDEKTKKREARDEEELKILKKLALRSQEDVIESALRGQEYTDNMFSEKAMKNIDGINIKCFEELLSIKNFNMSKDLVAFERKITSVLRYNRFGKEELENLYESMKQLMTSFVLTINFKLTGSENEIKYYDSFNIERVVNDKNFIRDRINYFVNLIGQNRYNDNKEYIDVILSLERALLYNMNTIYFGGLDEKTRHFTITFYYESYVFINKALAFFNKICR